MIRNRIVGQDTPFSGWLRMQEKELPSKSEYYGFVATDNDYLIHCYQRPIDSIGSRDVQALMIVEVKCGNDRISFAQRQTLYYLNRFANIIKDPSTDKIVRFFGVSFLIMSGTNPEDSKTIRWGRFAKNSDHIRFKDITKQQLIKLFRFDIHPDSLAPKPFRRHHQTKEIMVPVKLPLFNESIPAFILQRS
jgi:hypothetical protein